MPVLNSYSPDFCDIIWGGVMATGYSDDFIELEYDEDEFKMQVGALGDVTRTRMLNRTAKFKVTLMDASKTNDQWMALALADRQSGVGYKPFKFVDRSSNTTVNATQAWVMKIPKIMRKKESGTVEWMFECAFADINVGGSILPTSISA